MKDLLQQARVVVRTSNKKISHRYLADYSTSKNCTKKRPACAAQLFYLIQPIKSLIFDVVILLLLLKPKLPIDNSVTCPELHFNKLQLVQYSKSA